MFFFTPQLPGRDYEYHKPTQSPINPPYQEACHLRRTDQLAKPVKSQENDSINRTANDDSDMTCSKNSNTCTPSNGGGSNSESNKSEMRIEGSEGLCTSDVKGAECESVTKTLDETCKKVEKLDI